MNPPSDADVVIVGAGLAGATAAAILARKGVRVMLIDARQPYPPSFMAEKIEADQAKLFRKFGLLDAVMPLASRIRKVISARRGKIIGALPVEQYGIFYQNMVNAVRSQIPSTVICKIGKVEKIIPNEDLSHVRLMGGELIAARLVVLACGTGGNLQVGIGIRKHVIREEQSLSIGFNISRENEQLFSFEALTYYPDGVTERIAFLTLFPIQDIMRANLFVYRNLEEEWVKRFKSNPHEELMRTLPGLEKFTGPFRITSKIEMRPVDLYKVSGHIQPGVVLVGDAFQSVCPTTGMGLSKVLTDVDVLAECVPEWLRTAGMSNEKLADYYTHSRKRVCDAQSIRRAQNCRAMSTDSSFFWRARLELLLLAGRLIG